jgi:PAS domain S-box-containing protein
MRIQEEEPAVANVLVVDDEKSIRLTLETFLRNAGHQVVSAATSEAALGLVAEHSLDVAVLDILLGSANGLDLATRIVEKQPNVQVVFCTGEPEVTSAREAIRLRAFDYLAKPVSKDQIIAVVARAAEEKRRRDEYERLQAERTAHRERLECEVRERTAELVCAARDWQTTFDATSDVVFLLDANHRILRANAAVEHFLGVSAADAKGRHCCELVHGEDTPLDECPLSRSRETLQREEVELRVGDRRFLVTVDPVIDSEGCYAGAVHVVRDITERKRTEDALALSRERFDRAMEATRDGLYDWNLVSNEIYYSPGWKRMLGYEHDELPDDFTVWEDLTAPGDVKRAWVMQQELITKQRDRFEMEFRMKHKDGHWVDILSRATATFDEKGDATRVIGTHVDISALKRAQFEIQRERDRAQRYLDIAGVVLIALDDKQTVTMVNRRGCEILGAPREEIVGKNWFDTFLPPEQVEKVKTVYGQIMSGEVEPVKYYDNPIVRPDGTRREIAWHNSVLRDADGNVSGLLSSGEDVTEHRQAEQRIARSEELLRRAQRIGGVGAWAWDMKRQEMFWSEETYRIHGFDPEAIEPGPQEHIARSLECYAEEDRERVHQAFIRCVEHGEPYELECRFSAVDGRQLWIRTRGEAVREDDRIVKVVGDIQDVTDSKRAEEAVRRAAEFNQ